MAAFVAEAALIGGIADWFAVNALFRKPLGFTWHTELVPRHREQIINKVSEIVSEDLLSTDSIRDKIKSLNLSVFLMDWLLQYINSREIQTMIRKLLAEKSNEFDKQKIAGSIHGFVKNTLQKESSASEILDILQKSVAKDQHKSWLRSLFVKISELVSEDSARYKIFAILKEKTSPAKDGTGYSPRESFLQKIILNLSRNSKYNRLENQAMLIQRELISVEKQLTEPENPVFEKIASSLSEFITNPDNRELLINNIQSMKNGLLEQVDLSTPLQQLVTAALESDTYKNEMTLWLSSNVENYTQILKEDKDFSEQINSILENMLSKIIASQHHLIGEIAKETLETFDNDRLVSFIEDKAGEDLQWIRINGSIVGAIAGLVVYLFATLIYSPYIIPFFKGLL